MSRLFSYSTTEQRHFFRFAVASILGLLGLELNCLPIPLFANAELALGNVVVLLCASRMGRWPVLWCALVASTGMYMSWGNPLLYVTLGLEALVVCEMRRRGFFLLYADLLYWMFIGMPLSYWVLSYAAMPSEYLTFAVIKQGFNGLLYTAIASVILFILPKYWLRGLRQQPVMRRDFREKLTHGVVVLITLSSMLSLLVYSAYLMRTQQELLFRQMEVTGQRISTHIERYISRHADAVAIAGKWLPATVETQQQQLTQLHGQYDGFLSMLVTNQQGDIIAASPSSTKVLGLNVAQRPYFRNVINSGQVYVSSAFRGRGFGNDAIVAISAPWFDGHGQIAGIIEGSLDIQRLRMLMDIDYELKLVLTDTAGAVVVASNGLGIEPLSMVDVFNVRHDGTAHRVELISLGANSNQRQDYFELDFELGANWMLRVLMPYRPVAMRAEQQFLIGLSLLIGGLLLSIFLTRQLSGFLTKPLERLAQEVAKPYHPDRPMRALPRGSAREILLLQRELDKQRHSIYEHQEELEDKVAKRTAQLAAANTKLARLALRDGLTGAYNRRHFNHSFESFRQHSLRSDQPLLLALLDIDHFKAVNDTYGHLIGDDCLKSLVTRINLHFGRENDLLARYGGEEFVLLLPHLTHQSARQQLEKMRLDIAATSMATLPDGRDLHITVSIGAIFADATFNDELTAWLDVADKALYQAKQNGRNQLQLENFLVTSIEKKPNNQFSNTALTSQRTDSG
ncbi:diguanylate cyclase [uncultured Ferrimonas sp.]|uniref:diguanylate cyclase n=1 Tax=uncultured Ferrimonas sp. TaxID=432640 RepID=UPI00260334D5|nr:diguanylate cyclase [uncultured Ferrimonas sp.]